MTTCQNISQIADRKGGGVTLLVSLPEDFPGFFYAFPLPALPAFREFVTFVRQKEYEVYEVSHNVRQKGYESICPFHSPQICTAAAGGS